MVALPAGMYLLAYVVYEPFALPVLLLSGISTGLGVPFVLPSIVYILARSQFEIPLLHMMFLLSIALFTPLAAGWLTKKYFPAGSKFADKNSFPLSLVFIILINWGMFAKFAGFFIQNRRSCSKLWQRHSC